jgi:ABC-type amino acid transport substrate-binding protein
VDVSVHHPGDRGDSTETTRSTRTGGDSALGRIQSSGVLRVGYNPDVIPFSYSNSKGDLVGFDIAYAHKLASDLNVKLELIPFKWQQLKQDLESHRFDLAASGIYVTDSRLEDLLVSEPYYQSPIALIVQTHAVDRFSSRDSIRQQTDLTVGVFDDPVLKPLLERLFPNAKIKVISGYQHLPEHEEIVAAIWTLEQAKAWVTPRPGYTAVVPKNLGGRFLFAYLLPPKSHDLREFLDYWMQLQRANGLHDRLVHKWIDGKPEPMTVPRWSILRNVLGWEK